MTASAPEHFGGFLFAWREGIEEIVPWEPRNGLQAEELEVKGWLRLRWLTPPRELQGSKFEHVDFLVRQGGGRRFLLLGQEHAAVSALLKHIGIDWRVFSPPIDVHRVAGEMINVPAEYALGAVWARVDGYGYSLRTMGFFGSDLAEAGLFRELLPKLTCYQVRLRDVRRGAEVLLVGNRGDIGLHYRGQQSLTDADNVMRFLSRRHYISWQGTPE